MLMTQLFTFLARRTETGFAKTVLRRLKHSKLSKSPISLSKLAHHMKGKEDRVAVLVGTITDDVRLLDCPTLKVCALKITESARNRILKAGGKIYTFDELVLENPTGSNTVLLRGNKHREAKKHFGKAPGTPHSGTKPYTRSSGSETNNY